jgi:peptidoglycan/xylan/chitin deacetylase (PgdA/CDA1 family)
MKTILTLDYELFFGKNVGSPQVSIIECTNKLLAILNKFHAKAVFFVDVTYLLQLKTLKINNYLLQSDYDDVVQHIKKLESEGHQIQLHIHPHWLDSTYDNNGWNLNLKRYRLANWSKQEAATIIANCVQEINSHLTTPVFAFRAGGWCIQPFSHIKEAFKDNNIWLDSTIFFKGRSLSKTHAFDFLKAPKLASWSFEEDPCIESERGYFTEVPISSRNLSPIFYWKLAIIKKLGNKKLHSSFADGNGIQSSKKDMIRMLTQFSSSVVSIDGYKSSYLVDSYKKANKRKDDYFVVIGHPKLLTPFSLLNIEKWLYLINKNGRNLSVYSDNQGV